MNNASGNHGDVSVGQECRWVVIGKIDFANFLRVVNKVSILSEEEISGSSVKSNPALTVYREVSGDDVGIHQHVVVGCSGSKDPLQLTECFLLYSCFCLEVRYRVGIELKFVVAVSAWVVDVIAKSNEVGNVVGVVICDDVLITNDVG